MISKDEKGQPVIVDHGTLLLHEGLYVHKHVIKFIILVSVPEIIYIGQAGKVFGYIIITFNCCDFSFGGKTVREILVGGLLK